MWLRKWDFKWQIVFFESGPKALVMHLCDNNDDVVPTAALCTYYQIFIPHNWPKLMAASSSVVVCVSWLERTGIIAHAFCGLSRFVRGNTSRVQSTVPYWRGLFWRLSKRESRLFRIMTELVKPDRSISFIHCSHLWAIAMVLPVATAKCRRAGKRFRVCAAPPTSAWSDSLFHLIFRLSLFLDYFVPYASFVMMQRIQKAFFS